MPVLHLNLSLSKISLFFVRQTAVLLLYFQSLVAGLRNVVEYTHFSKKCLMVFDFSSRLVLIILAVCNAVRLEWCSVSIFLMFPQAENPQNSRRYENLIHLL